MRKLLKSGVHLDRSSKETPFGRLACSRIQRSGEMECADGQSFEFRS
jgi:hypothetical protein